MSPVEILIADDHEAFRRSLRTLIESRTDWHICGEAVNGKVAVEKAIELKPDITLLDVSMPEMNGLDAARLMRRAALDCKILIVSQNDPKLMEIEATRAGANGFISKSNLSRDLLNAVDALVNNVSGSLGGSQNTADSPVPAPPNVRGSELLRGDSREKHHPLTWMRPLEEGPAESIPEQSSELERKLRLDAQMLAAIVSSSDDAIISKNLDGIITSWNKSAERCLGYTAEEAIGQHIFLIIPRDRRKEEEEILGKIRRGERVDHFETIRVRKDGSLIDLSLTISPVKDSRGRVIGASKVARDISERKLAQEEARSNQARLAAEAEALRQSEEKLRKLSETLDMEVRARTRELEERNGEVLRQSEQLRELSWRLLRTQDEERRHIARELHDSAGQTLTALGMGLAQLVQKAARIAPDLASEAETIQEMVQQLHREIRTASYLLHPPLLDETGLSSALNWYVQGLIDRSGLEIALEISEDFGRLPAHMELAVFRLVQECLTNIHRHSASKTASIRIVRDGELLTIAIQDQGKGMSPARLAEIHSQGSGVGLRGMRERLRQFQGTMNIESSSSGTRVLVTIPIPKSSGPAPKKEHGIEPLQAVH